MHLLQFVRTRLWLVDVVDGSGVYWCGVTVNYGKQKLSGGNEFFFVRFQSFLMLFFCLFVHVFVCQIERN